MIFRDEIVVKYDQDKRFPLKEYRTLDRSRMIYEFGEDFRYKLRRFRDANLPLFHVDESRMMKKYRQARFRTSWGALQRPGQAFPQPRSPPPAAIHPASPLRSRSLEGLRVPRRKPPPPPPSSGSSSYTVEGSRCRRRHCRMRPRPRARCAHPVHLRAKPWPPSSCRRSVEPASVVC